MRQHRTLHSKGLASSMLIRFTQKLHWFSSSLHLVIPSSCRLSRCLLPPRPRIHHHHLPHILRHHQAVLRHWVDPKRTAPQREATPVSSFVVPPSLHTGLRQRANIIVEYRCCDYCCCCLEVQRNFIVLLTLTLANGNAPFLLCRQTRWKSLHTFFPAILLISMASLL